MSAMSHWLGQGNNEANVMVSFAKQSVKNKTVTCLCPFFEAQKSRSYFFLDFLN